MAPSDQRRGYILIRDAANYLFSGGELRHLFESRNRSLITAIESEDSDYILTVDRDEYRDYVVSQFQLEVPSLDVDARSVDSLEVTDEAPGAFGPIERKGIGITINIPFRGDATLLKYSPATRTSTTPRGFVVDNEVQLRYVSFDHDAAAIRREYEAAIATIQQYLAWVDQEVSRFNNSLKETAHTKIEQRRHKLLQDQDMLVALGIPLKRRPDAASSYSVPSVRRKTEIEKPSVTFAPVVREPALIEAEYEHILEIISNASIMMERSPRTFAHLQEEEIRDHFLFVLNSQYEGDATGETFNFSGKTDILIRYQGRNVFIAECKFWRGAKAFTETLSQLLSYSSWRDTKTAILLFNKNRNLSAVLNQIPDTVMKHPNSLQNRGQQGETHFRFSLHHRDDPDRQLTLSVLVFQVPRSATP